MRSRCWQAETGSSFVWGLAAAKFEADPTVGSSSSPVFHRALDCRSHLGVIRNLWILHAASHPQRLYRSHTMPTSRLIPIVLAGLALGSATGCESLLHNLKPHRLWRLNRHSPPMASGSSVYYSVPPPLLKDLVPVEPSVTESPNFNPELVER